AFWRLKIMARAASLLLLSVLYFTTTAMAAAPATEHSGDTTFIKTSCKSTSYPALCVRSLSAYADAIQQNPRQLVLTALSVSLSRAESAKSFVMELKKLKNLKNREIEAIADCLEEMGDTVYGLSKSIKEMKHLGQAKDQEFLWHMSNVETWVSAALTDENTCVDGFASKALNGNIKDSIKSEIINVAKVTSNALALINNFAASQ
ncbi:plant invertase/pectin methylesterase inhibitor family protein, partial [Citrobacter portucalensis]|nr:plant invertase/pectin methylesterase inhibitor family protein [Citrobacter portucalensis]